MFFRMLSATLAATLLAAPASAQEHAEHSEHGPNHISVVVGATDNTEDTALTFGIDYEYRFSRMLGLGVVAEHAIDDIDATTVLLVADLHFGPGFVVQTGPGVEFLDTEEGSEEEFVYRIGALYEFELGGGATLSPQLHYDITAEDDSVVALLAWGINF